MLWKLKTAQLWNYEKYYTVGGFQQTEWYKRKGHCTKRKKNAIGEQPHGKISHSFSKTYRETQNKRAFWYYLPLTVVKHQKKNWQFWICISKRYSLFLDVSLTIIFRCFDLNASRNLLHYKMHDEMYKCHCLKLFLKDCNELFKTAAVYIILFSFCSSHHDYFTTCTNIIFYEDGAVMQEPKL